MADGFFKGTTTDQDSRFADKQKKLIKSMKFPAVFDTKVDMNKVELKVIKPWIAEKVTAKLGFEDDVLISYIYGMLEETKTPDPKVMQINLTGFLESAAAPFMTSLWTLLVSAQNEIGGIPTEILEKKKAELKAQMAEQQRIAAQVALHAPPPPAQRAAMSNPQSSRVVGRQLGASDAQMESGQMGRGGGDSRHDDRRRSDDRDRDQGNDRGYDDRRRGDDRERDRDRERRSESRWDDRRRDDERRRDESRDDGDARRGDDDDDDDKQSSHHRRHRHRRHQSDDDAKHSDTNEKASSRTKDKRSASAEDEKDAGKSKPSGDDGDSAERKRKSKRKHENGDGGDDNAAETSGDSAKKTKTVE